MEGEQSRGVFMALAQKRRLSYLHAFYMQKSGATSQVYGHPRKQGFWDM